MSQGGSQDGVGYSKLPDGTYIQWGFFNGNATTNSMKNATVQITYPTTFSNTSAVSTVVTPTNANFLNGFSIDNIELSGFRIIFAGALAGNTVYNCGFRWVSIGRWK